MFSDKMATLISPEEGWVPPPSTAWDRANIELLEETGAPASRQLRVHYPAGSGSPKATRDFGAPQGGMQFCVFVRSSVKDSIGLRYNVRFPKDFNFCRGGKLPGLFGGKVWSGGNVPDGTNGFSTRYMWRESGDAEIYLYDPSCVKFGRSLLLKKTFTPGCWHCLEQRVTLNTIGEQNGRLTVFLDEEQVLDERNILYRTTKSLGIDGVAFSTFFGGGDLSWVTPVDTMVDFCGFAVGADVLAENDVTLLSP